MYPLNRFKGVVWIYGKNSLSTSIGHITEIKDTPQYQLIRNFINNPHEYAKTYDKTKEPFASYHYIRKSIDNSMFQLLDLLQKIIPNKGSNPNLPFQLTPSFHSKIWVKEFNGTVLVFDGVHRLSMIMLILMSKGWTVQDFKHFYIETIPYQGRPYIRIEQHMIQDPNENPLINIHTTNFIRIMDYLTKQYDSNDIMIWRGFQMLPWRGYTSDVDVLIRCYDDYKRECIFHKILQSLFGKCIGNYIHSFLPSKKENK